MTLAVRAAAQRSPLSTGDPGGLRFQNHFESRIKALARAGLRHRCALQMGPIEQTVLLGPVDHYVTIRKPTASQEFGTTPRFSCGSHRKSSGNGCLANNHL
jgi:hypothetical protein